MNHHLSNANEVGPEDSLLCCDPAGHATERLQNIRSRLAAATRGADLGTASTAELVALGNRHRINSRRYGPWLRRCSRRDNRQLQVRYAQQVVIQIPDPGEHVTQFDQLPDGVSPEVAALLAAGMDHVPFGLWMVL